MDLIATWMSLHEGSLLSISKISEISDADSVKFAKLYP